MKIATRGRTALSLALLTALSAATPAAAETFNVNTTADSSQCDVIGTCTVRGALADAQANGVATDDVINVPAGTYDFAGSLLMNSPRVTIAGAGANATFFQPVQIGRIVAIGTTDAVVRDLTMRGGSDDPGGNVLVSNSASATFERVRITGGTSNQNGGGIAILGATRVDIRSSLIDGNQAGASMNIRGGGISIESQTFGTTVTIDDTTIYDNSAWSGAGIGVQANTQQAIVLRGVTLARNRATSIAGGLFFSLPSPLARIEGSIVAGNVQASTTPSNCGPNRAADGGGNLESGADCGLVGHQNADPQLAAALDGSSPPLLTIPLGSPAVDIAACGSRAFDQRGLARPQGLACDAGAYEVAQTPVPPTPTPTPTPPVPTPTPTATPTPTPTPTPVVNRTVVVAPARGTVLVKRRGSSRYVKLAATDGIPLGSTVDTRKGVVVLTSIPKAGGKPESAKFFDGIFKVTQSRGITTLALTEALAPCSSRARAAQKKPKTRKLWGDGKGKFRTKGRYAAATVRGTKWLVQDGCRYTLTRVTQGSVVVRDEVKRKNIVLRKNKRYTARPLR